MFSANDDSFSLRLLPPTVEVRQDPGALQSTIMRLIASGEAVTRSELSTVTGLSRTNVSGQVDRLTRTGLLRESGPKRAPGRGRPSETLAVNPSAGIVLIADAGATETRLAIVDLGQAILAERKIALMVDKGPTETIHVIVDQLQEMLDALGLAYERKCIVIGLPARVDRKAGIAVRPPIMPGWDGFPVLDPLRKAFGCRVLLENDCNLRALGEARALPDSQSPLLVMKVGTGIGAGLVTEDQLIHRGNSGAAGEMGHITLRNSPPKQCRCGNEGCLEAVASIPALVERYRELAPDHERVPASDEEFAEAARIGDPTATAVLREAAVYLGEAVANMANIFNPSRVVLSGTTVSSSDDLLAGVRSMVYQHARPLATRHLQIAFSVLGQKSGIAGAAVLGIEHLLSPRALTQSI